VHEIRVEQILPPDPAGTYPRVYRWAGSPHRHPQWKGYGVVALCVVPACPFFSLEDEKRISLAVNGSPFPVVCTPTLSPAEVLTILVWGAWRGLTDKAKVYFHIQTYHRQEFPALGVYSKFVEATNRKSIELRVLLALMLHRNRHAQGAYPIVLQDSTALAVCHVARSRQHHTFRQWARKSKNGRGWGYGLKRHVQRDEAGRLCGFDLTTAAVDDRKLLGPLTRWMTHGIVVDYLSQAKAKELAMREVYLLTATRKNMRHLASQFHLAYLQLRHRVENHHADSPHKYLIDG